MGGTEKDNRLEALLNPERLQTLQENLAKALELAFTTVDYRGHPVTGDSGFSEFCSCMRKHEKYGHLCNQCYAHGGLRATIAGKPCVYRCHAGLVEFAVPVMVDGKYLGTVTGGQCELVGDAPNLEPVLPQCTPWEENPELVRCRSGVYKATFEKLEASARLVQDMLQNMLREEHCRIAQEELNHKNRELMEEKAARVNLELAMKVEEDSGKFAEKLDSEHLFYMLNVISRLAFMERAEETERTACDFAAMMRYVMENGDYHYVTIGEELEYIDYYLQIQRRRMEGRLRYEVAVPEMYHSTLCPFMLVHPLVKHAVRHVLDNSREGGSVSIHGQEERGFLLLTIGCEYAGAPHQITDLEGKRQGESLNRIDQSLKAVFGPHCGVAERIRKDGLPGTEILVRLPLDGTAVDR